MRIVVKLVMDVDAAEWAEAYSVAKADVRDNVKDYFLNAAWQSTPGQEGIITSVELG